MNLSEKLKMMSYISSKSDSLFFNLTFICRFKYKYFIISMRKRSFLLGLSLFLSLFLLSCISVEKQFEKGLKMEQEGRFEEAARYYIKVLKREPTWEEARERLQDMGSRSVDIHLISSKRERLMDEQTITSEVTDNFRRGVYDGDPAQLDLSLSEQNLFEKEELYRAEQELIDRLLDKLAGDIAESIFKEVLKYVR